MTGKVVQVHLGAAIQHGGDDGNPHTAANVARKVHQTGSGIVLVSRQKCIGGRVNGNEQECHADSLNHARGGYGPEINLKVEAGHVKQREGQA